MTDDRFEDYVVLTNPQSSGPFLSKAFQEAGIGTVHLYDEFLADFGNRNTVGSRIMVHKSLENTAKAFEAPCQSQ